MRFFNRRLGSGLFVEMPSMLKPTKAVSEAFNRPTENMTSVIPLLYQSGYFTIKDYNEISDLYVLDIPNKEIRVGLMESDIPALAEQAIADVCTPGNPRDVTIDDIKALYKKVL